MTTTETLQAPTDLDIFDLDIPFEDIVKQLGPATPGWQSALEAQEMRAPFIADTADVAVTRLLPNGDERAQQAPLRTGSAEPSAGG